MITTELPEQFLSIADELVPRASLPALRGRQVQSVQTGFRTARNEIWNNLSLPAITPRENASHSNIIDLYGDSQSRLEQYRSEANQWLERICLANVITYEDPFTTRYALRHEVDRIYKPVELPPLAVPDDVAATLAGNEIMVVHRSLEEALAVTLQEFLLRVAQSLLTLYEGGTLGSIEWTSNDMCRFVYSQREVRINDSTVAESSHLLSGDTRRVFSKRQDQFSVIDWDITHNLTSATINERLGLPHEAPQRIAQLWDSTPTWLRPNAAVVKGTLFRKAAEKVESWEDTVVSREFEDFAVPRGDPAVTLFNQIVLGAWDSDELEGNRTISVLDPKAELEAPARSSGSFLPSGGFEDEFRPSTALAFSLGWLLIPLGATFFASPGNPSSYFLPLVLAIAAIVPFLFSLRGYMQATNTKKKPSFYSFAIPCGISLACSSLAIPHMIMTKSPMSAIASVALVVFAVVTWFFARAELDAT